MQKMNRSHESHRVHLYGKIYRMRTHRATTTRVPQVYDGKVLQVLMTLSIKLERHNNNLFDLYKNAEVKAIEQKIISDTKAEKTIGAS